MPDDFEFDDRPSRGRSYSSAGGSSGLTIIFIVFLCVVAMATVAMLVLRERYKLPGEAMLGFAGLAVVVCFCLFFYFIPSFVAFCRGHPNAIAILATNFFLGWLFVGWVIALIWSFTAIQSQHQIHHHYHD